MKNTIRHVGTLIFLIGMFLFGITVHGKFHDSASVTNHIALGDVNISIAEYEMQDGEEILYENQKMVLPGDVISKIPRITNHEEPCYVRVKIMFHNHAQEISEEQILFEKDWIRKGEFYYYPQILDKNDTVELFSQIEIPSMWDSRSADKRFEVEIAVQAIQAKNFQPDFKSAEPWGKQTIQHCIHESDGQIICDKSNIVLTLELNGEASKILIAPEDFFSNFGQLMPGDVLKDDVKISNTTGSHLRLYFKTDHSDASEAQIDLMKQIEMSLSRDGVKIYQGNVASDLLEQELCLFDLQPDEKGTLSFELCVPKELDNTYALADGNVRWSFRAQDVEEEINNTQKTSKKTKNETTGQRSKNQAVKTGDDTNIDSWILILWIAAFVIGVTLFRKRGDGDV